ncbi:histidine kinase [Cohnella kolymensis]|uniref:histidine kinase n=2 Tax=Cohnella kolymensis TaxID=1590652 RepID=A0ABR5A4P6_9BACL|nr:histidine kinase [Cohnella kolymensis]
MRRVVIPFFIVFIFAASFFLEKQPSAILLLVSGFLLTFVVNLHYKIPYAVYLQPLLLALFHWSSHLNWCYILYIILLILSVQKKLRISRLILLAAGYSSLYTFIRLTYLPLTKYNLLVSVQDLMSFILLVFLMRYLLTTELEKRQLLKRNRFLITHDPLTGVLNYEGYIQAIEGLTQKKNANFVLVLLDFQDFKSVNNQSIASGNEILINISRLLQTYFPDALAISRYAGDRFALILPDHDNAIDDFLSLLDSKLLGYEVTYCLTLFPAEVRTVQEIIALAEDRLFQNKRLLWMKREEQMVQSEKMKIVGELAAGMAHEIRNPLTAMQGFMQLSKSQSYNIQPWFDLIMNEIKRMNELTAEFLQFSKPHISNMRPESMAKCIDRVVFLTESQATSRGHYLTVSNVEESVLVKMDRDKVVQVLLNLIRNAMEAMIEPGHIYVRARQVNKEVVVDIQDTGTGMPDDILQNIFNPFYTTKENGTGLGLSICYKIVQDHGGSLSVQSTVDEGSVFTVKLPVMTA